VTVNLAEFDSVLADNIIREGTRLTPRQIGTATCVEVCRRMARRGYVDGQIAFRLNTSRRQVLRWRVMGGIPAGMQRNTGGELPRVDLPNLPSDHPERRRGQRVLRTRENRAARANREAVPV
jgi:hypothetical protein